MEFHLVLILSEKWVFSLMRNTKLIFKARLHWDFLAPRDIWLWLENPWSLKFVLLLLFGISQNNKRKKTLRPD